MDYHNEEDATIFYLKFIQSIMCQECLEEFLEEAEEFGIQYTSIAVLEMIRDLVKAYTEKTSLPEEISKNIFQFVSHCRFVEEDSEGKKRRFQVCNEIIESLNRSRNYPRYPFYESIINYFYTNLVERTLVHARLSVDKENMEEELRACVVMEYYILYAQGPLVSEEEFMSFGVNFLLNDSYLGIVRNMLIKLPKLRKDHIFLKRTSKILDYNEDLLAEAEGHPDPNSDCTLDEGDTDIVQDKDFWKLHNKVKMKVARYQKDS